MSNTNIIHRLRVKFADYLDNKVSIQAFGDFLLSSVNALENKTDDIIEKARDFEYRFTCGQGGLEYGEKEITKVTADFNSWLDLLDKNYH